MPVYVLQHAYELDDHEDVKLIGVYSSEQRARDAIDRLKDAPGFAEHREGFCIDAYELDQDHWESGFS